jgi:hypothetical protein
MTWTTTKPTVPGWYWWRRPYGKRIILNMIQVKEWKHGNQPGLFIYAGKPVERCDGDWAGPLEPPKENSALRFDKMTGTIHKGNKDLGITAGDANVI